MRLLAGERKQNRKTEYLQSIIEDRKQLVYFKHLYQKYPYKRDVINQILKYLANEIIVTLKNLKELERLK